MRVGHVVVLAVIALAGCAGDTEKVTTPARPLILERISLVMAPETNDHWPAQVDLVRVRDVELVGQLLRTETRTWFAESRDAFRQAHPEALFDSWEVVPGTVAGPFDATLDDGPVAGVLFCGTLSAASVPPPIRFERDGEVTVHIDDEGCTLSGGSPSKEPTNWFGSLFDLWSDWWSRIFTWFSE